MVEPENDEARDPECDVCGQLLRVSNHGLCAEDIALALARHDAEACRKYARVAELRTQGLSAIHWPRQLGIVLEAGIAPVVGPSFLDSDGDVRWLPVWALKIAGMDWIAGVTREAQVELIRRLAADPVARAMAEARPGSIRKLLGAEGA